MQHWFFHFVVVSLALNALMALVWPTGLWSLVVVGPLILMGLHDWWQTEHSIRRNFPLFARGRWCMEALRPYVRQYFIESDTDATPISRMFRSIVYQRAKDTLDSVPYGTRVDTYRDGYEWIGHSIAAIDAEAVDQDMRVAVGGADCRHPYRASILNVSAMSFGALSGNAILALNRGAREGGFAHNTGEGGISPYHLEHGGDLVWQIGTGYFGCRRADGGFCAETFREAASHASVRMIELKLSQGAKPGHGGILPAEKNTAEIALSRGVEPGIEVRSPAAHSAFATPREMMHFIARLRELADGKPVGFKLAIGHRVEFLALCKAMLETGILPDFITVDGGEGGTGAAPLEFANSLGMPLREAVAFVDDCLTGFDLRQEIRVIAAGKVFTGFHIVKNLALGADMCNSARGMMLALGCVHSLTCHSNRCPTGVTTQDPRLYRGLVVSDKAPRVAQYHAKTLHAAAEIIGAAGLRHSRELRRHHLFRRINQQAVCQYDQIFPRLPPGSLLGDQVPARFQRDLAQASADHFWRLG
ncbi:FMN-binding glutamate synthase family protein [Halomonas nitroreducens]|uniref:FMN-binding glutamate synthase family protein n=1 Tax=Halomonas nitroreducens TaxID=447425 RepID=A0A431V8K3_9GAMM|nr:FMN-binding glutamate synthase family protein [Halomonas nitroreducens]RTR07008.1 FMN-binding glutamate synthase family protein [Halomonas nitroreducens]